MAVDVKFSVCQSSNCKAINFTETTGVYNASTNLTGWGAPNELTTDATAATLLITGPDGTVYTTIDLFATSSYPKSDSTSVSIDASTVSPSLTSFADGAWEMTYSVTTDPITGATYTETITFFFHCQVDKCVTKLVAALDINDCKCNPDRMNLALQAKAYADSLNYSVGCGDLTGANEILTSLNKLCNC
tara:strand:+ start:749 stop:1315 length:567 start_codon:yes stop_codon:yes gene_type:complete